MNNYAPSYGFSEQNLKNDFFSELIKSCTCIEICTYAYEDNKLTYTFILETYTEISV